MATFTFAFPTPELAIEAESQREATWRLARFFGLLTDGVSGDDPEYAALGLAKAAVTITSDLPPDPPPVAEADPAVAAAPDQTTITTGDVATVGSVLTDPPQEA